MTTIAQQLDNVLALSEKATPGPWKIDGSSCSEHGTETRAIYHVDTSNRITQYREVVEAGCGCHYQPVGELDAELIICAVNFLREHGPAIRAAVGSGSNVLIPSCIHPRSTMTVGPTTDQRNHHCPDCGASWTTWPERAAVGMDDPAYDFRWERDLTEGLSEYGYEAFVEGCPKDATRVIPLYRHPSRSGR